MDHHELLSTLRQFSTKCHTVKQLKERHRTTPSWGFESDVIMFPESHCPFCLAIVRSPGIWFISKVKPNEYIRLLGVLMPNRVGLIQASHPHDSGGGYLCLGKNATAVDLLHSTPNLNDSPMGWWYVPRWLRRYWNHDCQESRERLKRSIYKNILDEFERICKEEAAK